MQIKLKKLMACVLVVVLGLSSNVYPILAEGVTDETEISDVQESDASAGLVEDGGVGQETETSGQDSEKIDCYETIKIPSKTEMGSSLCQNTPLLNNNPNNIYNLTSDINNEKKQVRSIIQPEGIYVTGGVSGEDYSWTTDDYGYVLHILTSNQLTLTTNGIPRNFRVGTRGGIALTLDNCIIIDRSNTTTFMNASSVWFTLVGHNVIQSQKAFDNNDPWWFMFVNTGYPMESWQQSSPWSRSTSLSMVQIDDEGILGFNSPINRIEEGPPLFPTFFVHYQNNWTGRLTVGDRRINTPNMQRLSLAQSETSSLRIRYPELNIAGQWECRIDNGKWQPETSFAGLEPDTDYVITARRIVGDIVLFETPPLTARTKPIEYSVTIPETLAVGDTGEIALSKSLAFNIPDKGQVNVRLGAGNDMAPDGTLKLKRNSSDSTLINADFYVNNNRFNDVGGNVATFTNNARTAVPISFTLSDEQNIPAGTYTGTVTFEISYSD